MSNSKVVHTGCAVQNCKTTVFNRAINVTFHQFPNSPEMKSKWFSVLKTRCSSIDWNRSRICSKHFENKHFDSHRQLKYNAIPTLFLVPSVVKTSVKANKRSENTPLPQAKIDKLLNNLTQSELQSDIKNTLQQLKIPNNLTNLVNDDLKCQPNALLETHLWLLVKKQDHLITRLTQVVLQNKKHVEVLQKNMQESRNSKKEMEQALENYKYISKCLQEKHATLEEQIEILTAVESRN